MLASRSGDEATDDGARPVPSAPGAMHDEGAWQATCNKVICSGASDRRSAGLRADGEPAATLEVAAKVANSKAAPSRMALSRAWARSGWPASTLSPR
jgi:hypothetical protein